MLGEVSFVVRRFAVKTAHHDEMQKCNDQSYRANLASAVQGPFLIIDSPTA
jgi:hypothetical protein